MEKQDLAPKESGMKVTVYNMVGECQVEFMTTSENWGKLKKDLKQRNIKYEGMTAIIGETQEELVDESQSVKHASISLFLTPQRVESGSYFHSSRTRHN